MDTRNLTDENEIRDFLISDQMVLLAQVSFLNWLRVLIISDETISDYL